MTPEDFRFGHDEMARALAIVREAMPPTPAYAWPLLAERYGAELWVKHENHTPTGAFKVRGGLVYAERLRRERPEVTGLVSATRGNHGQSLAFAARRRGLSVTIVVPQGNSLEKNAAMRAFGARLIEHGRDFDEAKAHAISLAAAEGLEFVPSFHPDLVLGVATYAHEFFTQAPALDTVYCPIGLGSGLCGLILTRDLLGLKTEIVGVVADRADAYRRSLDAGHRVATASAATFADGMAVREPDANALAIMGACIARIVSVQEAEIADAMRVYFEAVHMVTEGAGAAALAAFAQERKRQAGRRIGIVLSGQNIDRNLYREILAGADGSAPG